MLLGITSLVLIFLPLLFQLIFGTISIFKPILFRFKVVSIINSILQIVFVITAFNIASYNFSKYFDQHPNSTRCAMPLVGLVMLSLLLTAALFAIIFIQYSIKKSKDKKTKS